MRKKGLITLFVVLAMMCMLGAMTYAAAETITTKDYFALRDGTMTFSSFTGSAQVVTTESATSRCNFIEDTVFGVNFPGSSHRFFNFSSDGYLMFHGAYFLSDYIYIPAGNVVEWLPDELEIGATYSVGWSRLEYSFSSCQFLGMGSDTLSITVTGPYTEVVDAGIFKTYRFDYVDNWNASTGSAGVSKRSFWLAKEIGFVKMEYGNHIYDLVSCSSCPPAAPTMELTTDGTEVTISWAAAFATEYTLFYAPYPYTGPETIRSIDMGTETGISENLWEGAAFYVAIEASNSFGKSGRSNIGFFEIQEIE